MRLYVVRHWQTLFEHANGERLLSEEGRLDAERLAAFLSRQRLHAKRLCHSGDTRARQTADCSTGP